MSEISIRSLSGRKTEKPWPKRSCTKALVSWECGSSRASLVPSRRQVPSERARDVVLTAVQATLGQAVVVPQHVGTRAPGSIIFAVVSVYGISSFASRRSRWCVMNRLTFTVLLLVAVGCCTAGRPSLAKPPQAQRRTTSAVQVDMRNVMYHVTDHVAVHILQLQGLVLPTQQKGLPVFDDVQSFTLAIHYAEIAIGMDALSHI